MSSSDSAPQRKQRVLVIDDEEQMRRAVRSVLEARHFEVTLAETGEDGLEAAVDADPDVIVLDLTLPGMDGFEVGERLREWYTGPLIVLSVRDADEDKIRALNLGADDYLTKPFSAGELIARIQAVSRRATPGAVSPPVVEAGDLVVDLARRRVTVAGEAVHLTRIEFDILALLATNPGRVVTSRMLLEHVWGPEYADDKNTLRVHVSHLRGKIERPGDVPRYVLTEPGVGFIFNPQG